MREESRLLLSHQFQSVRRRPDSKPILRFDPFDEPRLEHAPETVAEVPIPVLSVVAYPAPHGRIVSSRQLPGILRCPTVDPPAPYRFCDLLHRLLGRSRHAQPSQLAIAAFDDAQLEIISQEGERRFHVYTSPRPTAR